MTFLKLDHVTKRYGAAAALDNASLEIAAGEVHALMGENGAGKSTLIKVLAGVVKPDNCSLNIDGSKVPLDGPDDAARHGFRFIHQELNIVPHLSVAENIVMAQAYPRRFGVAVDWRRVHKKARAALERLDVDHIDTRRKTARLSTGDQMLVKIAATLVSSDAHPARLYVMDEPTAALTGQECDKLFAVIEGLKQSGASVLFVSHRMNEVMQICDRVTIYRDGRTIETTKIAETSRERIIEAMTGRAIRDTYPARAHAPAKEIFCAVEKLRTKHVSGLEFSLKRGEILGVAGLAESGQSEVLHAFLGDEKPLSGKVEFQGKQSLPSAPSVAWKRRIAYVPRERRREGLMLRRSIVDNAVLPHLAQLGSGRIFSSRRKERAHTGAIAERVRLKFGRLGQPCYQLSGGNQQKVVFARALGKTPELLLLDEPTRGVDVGAKFDIYTLVRELSTAGSTTIMTSSDLPELIGMCDRILVMRDHRQHAIVETDGLTPARLLQMFYE